MIQDIINDIKKENLNKKEELKKLIVKNIEKNILHDIRINSRNRNRRLPVELKNDIQEIINKYYDEVDKLKENQVNNTFIIYTIIKNSSTEVQEVIDKYINHLKDKLSNEIQDVKRKNKLPDILPEDLQGTIQEILNKNYKKIEKLENYEKIVKIAKNEVQNAINSYIKKNKMK